MELSQKQRGFRSRIPNMIAEAIRASTYFRLPRLYFWDGREYRLPFPESVLVKKVEIRPMLNPNRPIICIHSPQLETELLVEVAIRKWYTFTWTDFDWLEQKGIYCIKIDARKLTEQDISNDGLRPLVDGSNHKYWVYNPNLPKIETYLKRKFSSPKTISNGTVPDCPLMKREEWNKGRAYAIEKECRECKFCVVIDDLYKLRQVNCVGHMHDKFASCIQEAVDDQLLPPPSLF